MRTEVANRVLMLKKPVTAEVPASTPERRKWLEVTAAEDGGVLLIEFEHPADADTDGYLAPAEILDWTKTRYDDLDAVLAALAERGIDTNIFDAPWKMDYPL